MADRLVRDENDRGVIRRDVDMGDGTFGERMVAEDALTVPFFNGKQFRAFWEFNVPTGTTQIVKVVSTVNFILFGFEVDMVSGSLRISSAAGGTEGGSFSTPISVFARNTMTDRPTPIPTTGVTLTTGGTLTGQTILDVIRAQVSGQGSQVAGITGSGSDFRGLAPGTYYLVFTASGTDPSAGVLRMRWIER